MAQEVDINAVNYDVLHAFDDLAKRFDSEVVADAFVGRAVEFWLNKHGYEGLQAKLRTLNQLFARPIDCLIERITTKEIRVGEE